MSVVSTLVVRCRTPSRADTVGTYMHCSEGLIRMTSSSEFDEFTTSEGNSQERTSKFALSAETHELPVHVKRMSSMSIFTDW